MWFWYKETKAMLWEAKANELFDWFWLNKKPGRQALPKRELTEKEYMKLCEYDHAKIFTEYIRSNYPEIKFTHVANESWQVFTKNIMIMMAKKKAIWVSPWFPDYIITIPNINLLSYSTLYIELKKAKWPNWWWNWSELSKEQADWLNRLQTSVCCYCEVAHWSKQAIEIFENYISQLKNLDLEQSFWFWWCKNTKIFEPSTKSV